MYKTWPRYCSLLKVKLNICSLQSSERHQSIPTAYKHAFETWVIVQTYKSIDPTVFDRRRSATKRAGCLKHPTLRRSNDGTRTYAHEE